VEPGVLFETCARNGANAARRRTGPPHRGSRSYRRYRAGHAPRNRMPPFQIPSHPAHSAHPPHTAQVLPVCGQQPREGHDAGVRDPLRLTGCSVQITGQRGQRDGADPGRPGCGSAATCHRASHRCGPNRCSPTWVNGAVSGHHQPCLGSVDPTGHPVRQFHQVRADTLTNGGRWIRFAHWLVRRGATSVAWAKGLPGRRVMAQNSPQDGHG
jgi:hypothetical protein